MITEKDLYEAIAECQGIRNPNANTCLKLASYYTILDHIAEEPREAKETQIEIPSYSYANMYESESEFYKLYQKMPEYDFMAVMDELMDTLQVVNPRLYDSVIRKMKSRT